MDGVISLSSDSGSEQDSDIEFVGSYSNEREDSVPFTRAKLLAVTPVLIDITGHQFPHARPKLRRRSSRVQSPTVEVIDLNNYHFPSDVFDSGRRPQRKAVARTSTQAENYCVDSSISAVSKPREHVPPSSCTANLDKDVIYLDSFDSDERQSSVSVSSDQEKCSEKMRIQKPGHISHNENRTCAPDQSEIKAPERSNRLRSLPPKILEDHDVQEGLQNTKHSQLKFSPAADHSTESPKEHDEAISSPQSWFDTAPSLFSLDSPYYCPSEIDDFFFSEESNVGDNKGHVSTTCSFSSAPQAEFLKETADLHENKHTHKSNTPQAQSQFPCKMLSTSGGASPTSSLPCAQSCSPTSTEILAGDSPDTLASSPSLAMESPLGSPFLPSTSPLPSITEKMLFSWKESKGLVSPESSPPSQWVRHGLGDQDTDDDNHSESQIQDRQHISLVQFKKLKHIIGGGVQNMPEDDKEEDDEDFGQAEPLCRQSLSLVYSTIEESYPEGTLQLLSDLIQPRYYPPADITVHLLRGILLDPHSAEVLALEAYNLLMRTQKYHPADVSTVPWDWDLLTSVMSEQDEARRLRSESRCMLFQYVLQVLEDDFHFKLPILRLHLSIAKTVLSCDQKFRQVRDVMNWLLDAAKRSFCNSEDGMMQNREQSCNLKMLLILQRMLLLAMEVDRTPTCTSNKLSQELCNSLNSTAPCRQLRLLLLSTLESNLLRCKLLELLLDQACSQKRPLPMSFKLLLHFLQTSTLAPDPSDGTERWKRWDELLQLLWMLMLSYEEVMTGHLRYSITERFTLTRPPMWTQNDRVTRAAVQEAADAFLSRAVKDIGHALPSQTQESLSQLQHHLLGIRFQ
ncbi:uncharacterized protein simc1 isoform X1 [Salminus brasiliensis]|uniref:uncharacterized protein simc1 isoform X1 n=1 Tax=Salminus brasiliensis TaxID=930266 RepID=UPI003B82DB07